MSTTPINITNVMPPPRGRGRPRKEDKPQPAAAIGCGAGGVIAVVDQQAAPTIRVKRQRAVRNSPRPFDVIKNKNRKGLPITLYGLFDLWRQEGNHSPDYIRAMEMTVRNFIAITGVQELYDLERHHFLALKTEMLDVRKNSPRTYNFYIRHMRVLLRTASDHGFITDDILVGIKTITVYVATNKLIPDAGIKTVMEHLDNPKNFNTSPPWFWRTLIRCLYYTGVRRRQLVGLTWGDINLSAQTIHLRAEHSKTKREWSIPLPPQIVDALVHLQKMTEVQICRRVHTDDQLFNITHFAPGYRTDGKPATRMTVDHVSSGLRRIKDATAVNISSHRFRHTFASKMANANGGLEGMKELQSILGHTDIKTTLGYVEANMGKMRSMVSALGEI